MNCSSAVVIFARVESTPLQNASASDQVLEFCRLDGVKYFLFRGHFMISFQKAMIIHITLEFHFQLYMSTLHVRIFSGPSSMYSLFSCRAIIPLILTMKHDYLGLLKNYH